MFRFGKNAPLLLVLAAYLGYTALCFGIVHIIDIDTGRDFLIPDLMLQGRTLYRDVVYQYGPFAPLFHYLLFRLFEPSTTVILMAGAAAGLAIVLLTFFLAREILPAGVAAIASLFVLVHTVYAPHNMSYATPYTFSATYGLLFSLLAFYGASRNLDQSYSRWDWVTGGAAALALASKQDFAMISLLVLALSQAFRWRRLQRGFLCSGLAVVASYGIVTGLLALWLLRRLTLAELFTVYYPQKYLAVWGYFYQTVESWGPHAWTGARETLAGFFLNFGFILSGTCLVAWGIGLLFGPRPSWKLAVAAFALGSPFLYKHAYLAYYPILLHAAVIGCVMLGKVRQNTPKVAFLTLGAAVFLLRVLPAPTLAGYPYPLLYYIPSLIIYLFLCYEIAVPWLSRFFPEPRIYAAMTAVFLSFFVIYPCVRMTYPWARRTERIETERGTLRGTPPQIAKARAVLEEIRRRTSPGDPILLIPLGTMYYFLSNRPPASKYIDYGYGMAPEGEAEEREIRTLGNARPRLVIIDDLPQNLYFPGTVNTFGEAYDLRLKQWIQQNYKEIRSIRSEGRLVHFLVPEAGA